MLKAHLAGVLVTYPGIVLQLVPQDWAVVDYVAGFGEGTELRRIFLDRAEPWNSKLLLWWKFRLWTISNEMLNLAILLERLLIALENTFDCLFDVGELDRRVVFLSFFLISLLMKDLIVIFNVSIIIINAFWRELIAYIQQTDYRLVIIQALKLALHLGILEQLVNHVCVQAATCLPAKCRLLIQGLRGSWVLQLLLAYVRGQRPVIVVIIVLSILVISIRVATPPPSLLHLRVRLVIVLRGD